MNLEKTLQEFAQQNNMKRKGPLCVALVVTRHAKKLGLPLRSDELMTDAGGQVKGLGKTAINAILHGYGIDRILAEEGGRTSRGSISNMQKYSAFLNNLFSQGEVDLEFIEKWWIQCVKEYFAGKPFVLKFDISKSLRSVLRDLFDQAIRRQAQSPGATFVGTMLQHLIGAKLNLLLDSPVEHYGASVTDASSGRDGDFIVEDVAIHVTTSPSEALLRKCKRNLDNGLKPVIITFYKGVFVAQELADQSG